VAAAAAVAAVVLAVVAVVAVAAVAAAAGNSTSAAADERPRGAQAPRGFLFWGRLWPFNRALQSGACSGGTELNSRHYQTVNALLREQQAYRCAD